MVIPGMDKTPESKIVHLVSFNVPYPPDYGGVMDVFYKISALKQLGAGVILHCFSYGRSRSRTLERECLQVHYYKRDLNLFHIFRREPFIVLSRRNGSLLNNLLSDRNPVIFEGLHTTHLLDHPALADRIRMVRTHNIEHIYYRNLAANEKNPFRKLYYNAEARKLERYEPKLGKATLLLAISPGDTDYFRTKYGNSLFVGPFHPAEGCRSSNGKGDYVLVHGDFSTAENNAAARFILDEVAVKWMHKTVLAGKRPSDELMHAASALKHVKVIPNPSVNQMSELITNAQVCLLNASQPSGMKLKLINSLCSGRHVITSAPVVAGTRLESLCNIASDPGEWVSMTERLMQADFTPEMRLKRDRVLHEVADNTLNARKIIEFLNNYSPIR
ncbi:MAG: glycosyltransferase family 4 protein [Bacteroidales bacterium]|nr:glycosyltransferase family 4 protein [Bacteroidales bacterium]